MTKEIAKTGLNNLKSLRILVFSWRDPKHPNAGGAEQVMHEHMKGWVMAGHKVTLFSSRFAGSLPQEVLDGVRIIRSGDQYAGVKVAAFFFWQKHKDQYDLVVDQFHGLPFFTPLYIKKPILAVVQEVAGRVWLLNEFPVPINWIVGMAGYISEPVCFRFYRRVQFMVGSDSAKKDVAKMGVNADQIVVIPHGVVVSAPFPLPAKERIKTVVFLGALAKDKGVEDAIKTFAILNKKGHYQYWIIGKGSPKYQAYLYTTAVRLEVGRKTKFWGYVDQKKKFELLAKSHVLVNPSAKEGWGLVNIEANAVGIPVISYKSAGLVDSVKDRVSGLFSQENNPESLADKTQELLENRELYQNLQQTSINWSRRYSWEKSKNMSLQLLGRIVKMNPNA